MASIKQNKNNKKWDFVFDRYINGKRQQIRRRGFKTKREAQDKLVELQNEVKEDNYVNPSTMTIVQFIAEWVEGRKNKVEDTTVYNHRLYVKNHIEPFFEETRMQQLSPMMCQHFVDNMIKRGFAFNTIDRITTLIKMALDRAIDFNLIKKNSMRSVEMPKKNKREIGVWSVDEVNQFLNYTKSNSRYYCVYALALMTGMRQGEILGLRWQDIDFDNRMIYIRQTLAGYGKEFKSGAKTISGVRTVSISDNLVNILKKEEKKYLNLKEQSDSWYDYDLVIYANNGNRIFPGNLTRQFKKDIIDSEVSDIRFHDMRHTHATLLIQKNINVKIISERLGHSNISITLDTYSHVLPSMQQEVADHIDDIIK